MRTNSKNAHPGNGISAAWSNLRRKLTDHFQPTTAGRSKRLGLERLEPRLAMTGVVINEFLASNAGTIIQDEDGADSDYIELYNSGPTTENLAGWYLTDNDGALTKWQLPAVELDPGEYLVIFASSKNRIDPEGELHTNFNLSADGEYLALVLPDGTTIEDEFEPEYPEQFSDVSYGIADIYVDDVFVGQELRYFTTPTPGAANGVGVIGLVEDVEMSHQRGHYDDDFMLELSTDTVGAAIYYTYDGSVPVPGDANSHLYTEPIHIERTTVLRAAGYKEDFGASIVATHTYIFLEDVINQAIDRFNPANNPYGISYPASWDGVAGDYNMDPAIVGAWNDNNPSNDDFGIREALRALPTMSLVMDHADLWDPTLGIYNHAQNSGPDWRRPGSIEYFDSSKGEFQANTGVQIHGRGSRGPDQPKHSFRLIFNPEFDGPGRLEFPLFDQSGFDDINTVVLKGMNQDNISVKTVVDKFTSIGSTNMRDEWMLDTARAMGQSASEYTYAHLYVNGLYWGVYEAVERIDDASMASRVGGNEEDWDIIEPDNQVTGSDVAWNEMFALARSIPNNATTANTVFWRLQGKNPDGTRNEAYPVYLDMDNLADYLMVHYYAGANEWLNNFVAVRNRMDPGTGFKFYVWDQDVTFNYFYGGRIHTSGSGTSTAQELKFYLSRSPEFRLLFADHAQKHLFNGGALTNEVATGRWQEIAEGIEAAMVADTARWGDNKAGKLVQLRSGEPKITLPTITIDVWRDAVQTVEDFMVGSRAVIIDYFRAYGALFPTILAPLLNQFGGEVDAGFELELTQEVGAPVGANIYYTLDGSDPRLIGGGISPTAQLYNSSIELNNDSRIRARVLSGATWSAIVDTSFAVTIPVTRIPGDYDDSGVIDEADFDFWKNAYGDTVAIGTGADGNGDGVVNGLDYTLWRNYYAESLGPDYNFYFAGQTYTQNFNDFRGTEATLPRYFSVTVDGGTNIYRNVFNSTTDTAASFTGIKAATTDGSDHSFAWRESTGSAGLVDTRVLFTFTNNTNEPITGFQVSYDVEAWVNGSRDNEVRFKYDIYPDSTAAQAAAGRNAFESNIWVNENPNHMDINGNNNLQFVQDGKAVGNRATASGFVDLTTLAIIDGNPGAGVYGALQPGQTAYLRWQISNGALTNGNRSALGIDNISITAVAGVGPGGGGLAALGDEEEILPPLDGEATLDSAFARFAGEATGAMLMNSSPVSQSSLAAVADNDDLLLVALAGNAASDADELAGDPFGDDGESDADGVDELFAELAAGSLLPGLL